MRFWKRKNTYILAIFISMTFFLMAINYYANARYVGDTALYAQITKNIAFTGKAEGNIFANTQDFIDRSIAAIPIEERLSNSEYFKPPTEQSRNILRFHSCFILYLVAPLCYFMSAYSAVTLVQALALALSVVFIVLLMREKKIPPIIVMATVLLLISHPGWSMPAVQGVFYPERIFMGTGMYLVWACEKEKFSKMHFCVATMLCILVGERGALYAGMFILAHTIFYWKRVEQGRIMRLVVGATSVLTAALIMKLFLTNLYYSNLASVLNFHVYLSNPQNVEKVVLFLIINVCVFGVVAIFDWRAFIIGMASMVPNLLYNVGGAEKIGWTLHYHVFYFVFLMWAVAMGVIKLYEKLKTVSQRKAIFMGLPVCVALCIAFLVSAVNPTDTGLSIGVENLKNNVIYNGTKEIKDVYLSGERECRKAFNELVQEHIESGATVTTVEAGMCALEEQTIHIFPMGIEAADVAIVAYKEVEGSYLYGGSVVYSDAGDQGQFDQAVVLKMQEYGYDFENAIRYPAYGLAIITRNE